MVNSTNVDKLVSTAKAYLWPTFGRDASFFGNPVSIIESGEGRHITDSFGNRLLETMSCGAAAPLGFNLPELVEAVIDQIKKINVTTPGMFAPAEPVVWLAEKIASLSPGDMKYTIFGSNGGDANETAIKIARNYWKIMGKATKYKVIHRYPGDYHGMGYGAASASGHSFRRTPYEPLMAGFPAVPAPNCYRCPYNLTYPECNLLCAQQIRHLIEFEDPSTIALLMVETTNTGLGMIPSPPGYMKMVRDICNECDILLHADEVITGFGKSGFWFESEKQGIVPDMIAMGKGVCWGAGPLAGTHVRPKIAEAFTGQNVLRHGYTFGGMGYLAAAGLAGINYVEKHKLLDRVKKIGDRLSKELEAIKNKYQVIGDVRGNGGAIAAVEFVKDRKTKEVFPDRAAVAKVINQVGRDNGVLFSCNTWYGDIIFLVIQFNMTDEELSTVISTVDKAAAEVEKQFR